MRLVSQKNAPILLPILILAGCAVPAVPIAELERNPGQYDGKSVAVKGRVVSVTKLPFVALKNYTLRDDTGEILVLTEGDLPAIGQEARVNGTFSAAVVIGGHGIGLVIRESSRD